jgi:hypothetical protein
VYRVEFFVTFDSLTFFSSSNWEPFSALYLIAKGFWSSTAERPENRGGNRKPQWGPKTKEKRPKTAVETENQAGPKPQRGPKNTERNKTAIRTESHS